MLMWIKTMFITTQLKFTFKVRLEEKNMSVHFKSSTNFMSLFVLQESWNEIGFTWDCALRICKECWGFFCSLACVCDDGLTRGTWTLIFYELENNRTRIYNAVCGGVFSFNYEMVICNFSFLKSTSQFTVFSFNWLWNLTLIILYLLSLIILL